MRVRPAMHGLTGKPTQPDGWKEGANDGRNELVRGHRGDLV